MASRILILEDDEDLREELADALADEGHEVVSVAAGLEAVARAREQSFDLVVTDVRMGGVDGLEALARMKNHRPDLMSLVSSAEGEEIRLATLLASLSGLTSRVRQRLQSSAWKSQKGDPFGPPLRRVQTVA